MIPAYNDNQTLNDKRRGLRCLFENHFINGPKYTPDSIVCQKYIDFYRDSNEWVRLNFFSERQTLFSDEAVFPELSTAVDEAIVRSVAFSIFDLWERKN